MRMKAAISLILLSLAAGAAGGYLLRAQRMDGSVVLSLKDAMKEEYLAPPDSFSRIKNTRNSLDALSERLAMGIMDALLAYDRLPKRSEAERKQAEQVLERAIGAAEAAEQEFEGTEQQLEITPVLLAALQKAECFDRWTELYLKTLFAHPTHDVVARFANDAVKISKLAGQEKRVLEALDYLSAFPAEFAGRAQIQASLGAARPCFSLVQICQGAIVVGDSGPLRYRTRYQTTPTFLGSELERNQIELR